MIQHVSVMLTDQCNSRCKYCYVDAGAGQLTRGQQMRGEAVEDCHPGRRLDAELVRQFLRTFAAQNGKIVHFTGGEVLLYPELQAILEYARELGLVIQIFTNGLLLDEERFLQMKDLVSSFAISLDGPEEVHDANRGVQGAYAKVIDVLQLFKAHMVEYSIQMTIGRSSLAYIDHVAQIAKQYNAGSVKLANLMQVGRGMTCPEEHLSVENLLLIKQKARQLSEQYHYRPIFQTNLYTEEEMRIYFKSDALLPSFWVDAGGDLCIFNPAHKGLFKISDISEASPLNDALVREKTSSLNQLLLPRLRHKQVCDLYEEIEKLAGELEMMD